MGNSLLWHDNWKTVESVMFHTRQWLYWWIDDPTASSRVTLQWGWLFLPRLSVLSTECPQFRLMLVMSLGAPLIMPHHTQTTHNCIIFDIVFIELLRIRIKSVLSQTKRPKQFTLLFLTEYVYLRLFDSHDCNLIEAWQSSIYWQMRVAIVGLTQQTGRSKHWCGNFAPFY